MGLFKSKLIHLVGTLQPVTVAVAAVALFVIGVMLVYPSERSKTAGKEALPWVAIGSAVALSATTIAKALTSGF